ncbi:hypothetical protein GR157_32875 [Burkholderia sp. 4701]|nr:hypothetical protein [Burkholderia sp. 4701]MXN86815.1 hypothetical protein [Burkholderia sp. 4812]
MKLAEILSTTGPAAIHGACAANSSQIDRAVNADADKIPPVDRCADFSCSEMTGRRGENVAGILIPFPLSPFSDRNSGIIHYSSHQPFQRK